MGSIPLYSVCLLLLEHPGALFTQLGGAFPGSPSSGWLLSPKHFEGGRERENSVKAVDPLGAAAQASTSAATVPWLPSFLCATHSPKPVAEALCDVDGLLQTQGLPQEWVSCLGRLLPPLRCLCPPPPLATPLGALPPPLFFTVCRMAVHLLVWGCVCIWYSCITLPRVCVCVTCAPVSVSGDQRSASVFCLSIPFHPVFLRRLSLNLKLSNWARLAGGMACPCLPSTGLTGVCHHSISHMGGL